MSTSTAPALPINRADWRPSRAPPKSCGCSTPRICPPSASGTTCIPTCTAAARSSRSWMATPRGLARRPIGTSPSIGRARTTQRYAGFPTECRRTGFCGAGRIRRDVASLVNSQSDAQPHVSKLCPACEQLVAGSPSGSLLWPPCRHSLRQLWWCRRVGTRLTPGDGKKQICHL